MTVSKDDVINFVLNILDNLKKIIFIKNLDIQDLMICITGIVQFINQII